MKLKCQSVQVESFRGSYVARRTDESRVQCDNICAKETPRRRTNVRYCMPAFPQSNFPLTLPFFRCQLLIVLQRMRGAADCSVPYTENFEVLSDVTDGIKIKKIINKSSGATALQGFGRQSGRHRSAKLVPTFAARGTDGISHVNRYSNI